MRISKDMPWLADMKSCSALNRIITILQIRQLEKIQNVTQKRCAVTQIHPRASRKTPKLSYEQSLTSEKLYNTKSEMEKTSETLSSISCATEEPNPGVSQSCALLQRCLTLHITPKKPCSTKKWHPQAGCGCLTPSPNLKHSSEWLFYSGDFKFINLDLYKSRSVFYKNDPWI